MKFGPKFNGIIRSNGDLTPLEFRNKMVRWHNNVSKIRGFIPKHGLLVLRNSLTDRAEQAIYKEDNMNNINEFLAWFDKTYNVVNLRKHLHNKIDHWKINKTTPRIKIVDEFKYYVSLFDQSGHMATNILKQHTEFTHEQLVQKLTCQFKQYDQLLWDEFLRQTSNSGYLPTTLDELQYLLESINARLTELEVMSSSTNSYLNSSSYSKYNNDNITDIGTVNVTRYNDNNNYNYNNNNYRGGYSQRGRNTRGRGRGYYNNRGNRGNYRSNNNNNYNSRGRGGYRGNNYYNNNDNNNYYRGNNYRGNRGYRSNYRGSNYRSNYRGYNNNNNNQRRYNNNNNNNNYDTRTIFMPRGDPKFFTPQPYAKLRCRQCNKWGHRVFYCEFMNKYFPEVTDTYDKLDFNKRNSVSSIRQDRNENISINNNNNNNNNNINNTNGSNPSNYGVYPGFQ